MALNFDEFQKVVETAQQADAVKADLKRALKKISTAIQNLQESLSEMDAMLTEGYVAAPRTRKPRTPKAPAADGSAPKRPGRPRKNPA